MPGINLVHKVSGSPGPEVDELLQDYTHYSEISTENDLEIWRTGYPDYPVQKYEIDEFTAILEGVFYNTNEEEEHLRRIVTNITEDDNLGQVLDCIEGIDGDFNIYLINRSTGKSVIINDIFGRLPTYCIDTEYGKIVTRELEFAYSFADSERTDWLGIAQFLLFGYSIGERTFNKDVKRIKPGSITTITDDGIETEGLLSLSPINDARTRTVEENGRVLAKKFKDACKHRYEGEKNVVSLSGGLDSRSVAGALNNLDIEYTAATYRVTNGRNDHELATILEIINHLEAPWELYHIQPGSGEEMMELLRMKRGNNSLGNSNLIPFLNTLKKEFGSGMNYVTGDGGAVIKDSWETTEDFDGISDLIDAIISEEEVFDIERVTNITGVHRDEIRDSIKRRLDHWDQLDLRSRYTRFLLMEHGLNGALHGEDRNRYWFWSSSPFFSSDFVQYAISCPASQKKYFNLYAEFINSIDSGLLEIKYPNFDALLNTREFELKIAVFDKFIKESNTLTRVARRMVGRNEIHTHTEESLEFIWGLCDGQSYPLNEEYIKSNCGNWSRKELYYIATLLSELDLERKGKSSEMVLEDYANLRFE